MPILLGRVLVLITCTGALKLDTVTISALLIWYGGSLEVPADSAWVGNSEGEAEKVPAEA